MASAGMRAGALAEARARSKKKQKDADAHAKFIPDLHLNFVQANRMKKLLRENQGTGVFLANIVEGSFRFRYG